MRSIINRDVSAREQLKTLVFIRWLYIFGQSSVIAFALFWFNYNLSLLALLPLVALEVIVNISTRIQAERKKSISTSFIWGQLVFDLLCISLLLYFTGGATNAFVSMLLLPVTLAALLCDRKRAWTIAILSIIAYSFMMQYYRPLQEAESMHHMPDQIHFIGMWLTFTLSVIILVFFINQLSGRLADNLLLTAELKEQQVRDEGLMALANNSASAAHRLSTPLNTIELLVEELRLTSNQETFAQLDNQLERAREIIGDIRNHANVDYLTKPISTKQFISDLTEQWSLQNPSHQLALTINLDDRQQQPTLMSPLAIPALLNLLENAARENEDNGISLTQVSVSYLESKIANVQFEIFNHVSKDNLIPERLGENLVASEKGLGVGFYLAHSTIERLGGDVELVVEGERVITRATLPEIAEPNDG